MQEVVFRYYADETEVGLDIPFEEYENGGEWVCVVSDDVDDDVLDAGFKDVKTILEHPKDEDEITLTFEKTIKCVKTVYKPKQKKFPEDFE